MSTVNALSVADVAEILEVSEESVRRWIRENKLAADRKLGRTGHTIHLAALVDFTKRSSADYWTKLHAWLDAKNISIATENPAVDTAAPTTGEIGHLKPDRTPQKLSSYKRERGHIEICPENTTEASEAVFDDDFTNQDHSDLQDFGFSRSQDSPYILSKLESQSPLSGSSISDNSCSKTELFFSLDSSGSFIAPGHSFASVLEAELQERLQRKMSEIRDLQQQIEQLEQELKRLEVLMRLAQKEAESCDQEIALLQNIL